MIILCCLHKICMYVYVSRKGYYVWQQLLCMSVYRHIIALIIATVAMRMHTLHIILYSLKWWPDMSLIQHDFVMLTVWNTLSRQVGKSINDITVTIYYKGRGGEGTIVVLHCNR